MPIERFFVGPMGNNAYVLYDEPSKEAILVDPSMGSEVALEWLTAQKLSLRYVLNTHGHADHVFNNAVFVERSEAKLSIHEADAPMLAQLQQSAGWMGTTPRPSPAPDVHLEDGMELPLGDGVVRVIGTPGHTPGSSCFVYEDSLLTGDTLFQGSIGRFDFPGGSLKDLVASIKEKLFTLPSAMVVLPGHNDLTTIDEERRTNPFVGEGARMDLSQWQT